MKLIIPMAGRGTRLRPHTLTTPKPLLRFCGNYILETIIKTLINATKNKINEVVFVVSDIEQENKEKIKDISKKHNLKYTFATQEKPLGTAHAIGCAKENLKEEIFVVFADTLFFGNIEIKENIDACVWTYRVDDPSSYGVVITNEKSDIIDFKEKPKKPISNKAIIGLYYFKKGERLLNDINYIINKGIKDKEEYQLTTVLSNMLVRGDKIKNKEVDEWLDCGTVEALLEANKSLLQKQNKQTNNSQIIQPCFIGDSVEIKNSIIGPNVSIDKNTKIESAVIKNTIIGSNTNIKDAVFSNSLIGNNVKIQDIKNKNNLNMGDYSQIN